MRGRCPSPEGLNANDRQVASIALRAAFTASTALRNVASGMLPLILGASSLRVGVAEEVERVVFRDAFEVFVDAMICLRSAQSRVATIGSVSARRTSSKAWQPRVLVHGVLPVHARRGRGGSRGRNGGSAESPRSAA